MLRQAERVGYDSTNLNRELNISGSLDSFYYTSVAPAIMLAMADLESVLKQSLAHASPHTKKVFEESFDGLGDYRVGEHEGDG